LTFYPQNKGAPPLRRVEKNIFEVGRTRYQKKLNFALISKMCRSLEFGKREKNFWDLENFAQNHFSEKKSLGTS
jgi:hypothetical protein